MSHLASTWAWAQEITNAKHKLLLVKLADSANDDGVCWPSLRTLSKHTGISKSALSRIGRALEEAGFFRIQETLRADGSRGPHVYHLALGGVPPRRDTPVPAKSGTGVSHSERDAESSVEPSVEPSRPSTAAAVPSHLGDRRWHVPSPRSASGFEVDLGRVPVLPDGSLPVAAENGKNGLSCTCENRAPSICRHQKAAAKAESKAAKAYQRKLRNAIHDALVECFGAPTERQKAMYGSAKESLWEALSGADGPEAVPEVWGAEVRRRYNALVLDWGVGKVTLNGFANNWGVAGKLLNNDRSNGNNVGDAGDEEHPFDRGTIRIGGE